MKIFITIVYIIITILFIRNYVKTHKNIYEKIDGVETINGIKYIVYNTDVEYVMDRFSAIRNSKIINEKHFEKISDSKGTIKFGGVVYPLNLRGSERDFNIGATYEVFCQQFGNDVIISVKFVGREFKWWSPSYKEPGLVLNQAYHRWFKELLDVKVYKEE